MKECKQHGGRLVTNITKNTNARKDLGIPDTVKGRAWRASLGSFLACLVAATAVACAPTAADDVAVSWALQPKAPVPLREVTAHLSLRDASGTLITGARLRVEAHMSHPGMAPIISGAEEPTPGMYEARIELSMAGAWTLVADGTLPDGRRLTRSHSIDVRPAP